LIKCNETKHCSIIWLNFRLPIGIGLVGFIKFFPNLISAVSDVAHPDWRASAVGVYRLWRDAGYAVGALTAGLLADAFGGLTAIAAIGALTFISGAIVAAVMRETHGSRSNEATLIREQAVKRETTS